MRKNEVVESFAAWLSSFPVGKPSLKVNGSSFASAVVTVDFGSPLEPVKLTGEQNGELHAKMKEVTTALTGRRNVRVQTDNANGILWASI